MSSSDFSFRLEYWQKILQYKIDRLKETNDERQQIALKQQIDLTQQVIMRINRRERNLLVN